MTRYADPHHCPDCGAAITSGAAACLSCALPLRGLTAQRLFTTLTQADQLLVALRSSAVRPAAAPLDAVLAGAGARGPVGGPLDGPVGDVVTPPWPPYPTTPEASGRPRRGLSVASVPMVLLGLGAACLLVAALVFLAVAWSALGVGGRTATLVVLTGLATGVTAWLARRGLRAASEALALVGSGLLTLDVLGADHAGWFGDLPTSGLLLLLGAVLVVAGTLGTLGARTTPIAALVGTELVAGTGTALAGLGIALGDALPTPARLLLATLFAAAATLAGHRLRMRVATVAAAAVTVLAWLALTGDALARTADHATFSELWGHGQVWPLLVAAALVGVLGLPRRLAAGVRVGCGSVALLLVVGATLAPASTLSVTGLSVVALVVLVVAGVASWTLPRPWGLVTVLTQGVAGLGVLAVAVRLAGHALERVATAVDPVWAGRAADRLGRLTVQEDLVNPWLLPAAVVVALGTGWALARAWSVPDRTLGVVDRWVGAGLALAAVVAALALEPVPLWLLAGVPALVAAAAGARWRSERDAAGRTLLLALGAAFALAALVVSLHAPGLTASTLVVVGALAALVHACSGSVRTAGAAGALLAAAIGALVWSTGWAAGARTGTDPVLLALAGQLLLGALVLAAPYAPARLWRCPSADRARAGTEVGAALGIAVLGAVGVALAPSAATATWAAVHLTAAGVVATLVSLLRADRRAVGWLGGLLLAAATWVRLWDLGVHAPEAYTLPAALALLVVGLVALRRDPATRTSRALTPGLSLALAPSLLWVLEDPRGPRTLLLGLGVLVLVLAGAWARWSAPLVLGGAVGAVLVLRLAAPYVADALPRWVLIGIAGALLVAVGASWERRLGQARAAQGYVRSLR